MIAGKITTRIAVAAVCSALLFAAATGGNAIEIVDAMGTGSGSLHQNGGTAGTETNSDLVQSSWAAAVVEGGTEDGSAAALLKEGSAAIKQAKKLKLMPEQATVSSAKQIDGIWSIAYTEKGKRNGTVLLDAESGSPVEFRETMGKVTVFVGSDVPVSFFGEEKVDYTEAVSIAEDYPRSQGWNIEAVWTPWRYTIPAYALRYETTAYHRVELVRTLDGIRYDNNRLVVYIDRESGEVVAHTIEWSDTRFELAEDPITPEEAAATFYRDTKPFLQPAFWSTNAGEHPPQYATQAVYTINASGEWSKEWNVDAPASNETLVGSYPQNLAKMRLLSLYDLEPVYLDDSPRQASLHYQLRIKPAVRLAYMGEHPFIHAHTGEWMDFGETGMSGELPPASDWLIAVAVPEGKVGYTASIVWNNELLPLRDEPVIRGGSTLLPFRELLEKLGASVQWDPAKRKVTASKSGVKVELTISSGSALVNGKPQPLGAPAAIVNNRTYIPARIILEAFGAKVGWNEGSRLVLVDTGEDADLPALSEQAIDQLRFAAQISWEERHHARK